MNVSYVSNNVQNVSKIFNGTKYVEREGAREWFWATLVLAWMFAILTITLNIAVIVCICRQKKKSRLYFLLLNMAVADCDALPAGVPIPTPPLDNCEEINHNEHPLIPNVLEFNQRSPTPIKPKV
ncbi:hypothetical protein MAR_005753 [Mya arenaria]|uniref:Uncharacterized protein n=1 Tax=Mya arenaria TaxID=6604 RepID=A0ABY7F0D5_MYAAR|nr:hypothetical protein MAR_005753 [Mya arenaria]